jgi:class 3 adenylate cyclase
VKAALRMNARVIDFNSELPSKPLRLRIGINTGEVLAGAPGPDLMVTGDALNVAARLQGAASPGQIVVSERTARAVRDSFFFTPLDAQQLAGRSAPVRAFLDSLGRRNDVGTAR